MSDTIAQYNHLLMELSQQWIAAFAANDWQMADQLSRQMDAIESEIASLNGK